MPEPRLEKQRNPLAISVQGRPLTEAEQRQRLREGEHAKQGALRVRWATLHNGMPEFKPYVWHNDDEARQAEVAAYITWARQQAAQRIRDIDRLLTKGDK